MNGPEQENNSHSLFDEQTGSNELNASYGEYNPQREEIFTSRETPDFKEFVSRRDEETVSAKNKRDKGSKLGLLSRLLPSTAVFLAAGTALTVPLLTPPKLQLQNERVSYNLYECVLSLTDDERPDLFATVIAASGQELSITPILENGGWTMKIGDLLPESEYTLKVADNAGNTRYLEKFTTDPFVYTTPTGDNLLSFSLHGDMPLDFDFGLRLIDAEGKDFSSSLMMNSPYDMAENFIYLDSLYEGEYAITLEQYPPDRDEPIVYEKRLQLGNLTPLQYDMTMSEGTISLRYLSGDITPYTPTELTLISDQTGEYFFFSISSAQSPNDFVAELSELPPSGSYRAELTGEYTSSDNNFYNQIWCGKLTIPPTP